MRVAAFGPRELSEEQQRKVLMVWTEFRQQEKPLTYVHGGSKGVQELLLKYEQKIGHSDIIVFRPWHFIDKKMTFSPKIMVQRNLQILDNCDLVILFAFEPNETKWTEDYCEQNEIDCIVVKEESKEEMIDHG